jgi:hypothetical protein
MSRADIILLAVAAYVSVMTLVRLMKTRRDALVADVQKQVAAHRRRVRKAASKAAEEDRNAA